MAASPSKKNSDPVNLIIAVAIASCLLMAVAAGFGYLVWTQGVEAIFTGFGTFAPAPRAAFQNFIAAAQEGDLDRIGYHLSRDLKAESMFDVYRAIPGSDAGLILKYREGLAGLYSIESEDSDSATAALMVKRVVTGHSKLIRVAMVWERGAWKINAFHPMGEGEVKKYMVSMGGEKHGPYTQSEIKAMCRAKRIPETAQVFDEGKKEWTTVKAIMDDYGSSSSSYFGTLY